MEGLVSNCYSRCKAPFEYRSYDLERTRRRIPLIRENQTWFRLRWNFQERCRSPYELLLRKNLISYRLSRWKPFQELFGTLKRSTFFSTITTSQRTSQGNPWDEGFVSFLISVPRTTTCCIFTPRLGRSIETGFLQNQGERVGNNIFPQRKNQSTTHIVGNPS